MEPAVHIGMGGVVDRPIGTHASSNFYCQAVNGHSAANSEEHKAAAKFSASRKLIEQNECDQYHGQTKPLI